LNDHISKRLRDESDARPGAILAPQA